MEWHANGIAPRILMPKKQTIAKIKELIAKNSMLYEDKLVVLECVVYELSDFFGVSRLAAKIRMLDLGYKEVEGVFTYIDDRYIQNYAFNADSKERNQTYCIGLSDSFFEYFLNPEFRKLLDSGNFVYIDGHFVINDSKYVILTGDNEIGLTDYAKQNIHECCLRFDLKLNKTQTADYSGYYADVMFKSAETVTCNPIFNSDDHNMEVFNRSEDLKKFHADLMTAGAVAQNSAKNFCQLAWMHIERTHCDYKETFREGRCCRTRHLIASRRVIFPSPSWKP